MRILFVSIFCFLSCSSLFAQDATISGRVLRRGVRPMISAHVVFVNEISGARFETRTDESGAYHFEGLPLNVSRETSPQQNENNFVNVVTNNGGADHNLFFRVAIPQTVTSIYNVLGERVRTIRLENARENSTWIARGYWDGRSEQDVAVSDGIYFATLDSRVVRIVHHRGGTSGGVQGVTAQIASALRGGERTSKERRGQLDDVNYRVTITPDRAGSKFRERTFTSVLRDGDNGTVVDTVYSAIPQRVLFVGNSYTYYNGGLDAQVYNLSRAADSTQMLFTSRVAFGGYTLENHFNNAETRAAIDTGRWDMVILQEQSTRPIDDPPLMFQYAAQLDGVISLTHAETGFFMTWARAYDPAMIEGLAAAYDSIGHTLGDLVAPVGRAWQLSLQRNPLLTLHESDDSHPNVYGTYLAACVFYAALFQRSPVGIPYVNDPRITDGQRDFLQQIAWETVQIYEHRFSPWAVCD
jgi:hypothetical protein